MVGREESKLDIFSTVGLVKSGRQLAGQWCSKNTNYFPLDYTDFVKCKYLISKIGIYMYICIAIFKGYKKFLEILKVIFREALSCLSSGLGMELGCSARAANTYNS